MALILLLGIFFPRIVILVLYFLTNWFPAAFDNILWAILGFLFLPLTTIWYAYVESFMGGAWSSTLAIAGLVVGIVIDLGLLRGYSRRRTYA